MNYSRISIDAYNPNSDNLISCSKNGNAFIYCTNMTCFTIKEDGVFLNDFRSFNKKTGQRSFHLFHKCYKDSKGIYVNIDGNKCYCTDIAPTWMTRESIFC